MSNDVESSDTGLTVVNSQHAFLALVVIALSTAVWCSRRELQKIRGTSPEDSSIEPTSIPMEQHDLDSEQRDKSLPRSKERRKRGKEPTKERTTRKALQAALREKPSETHLKQESFSQSSNPNDPRSGLVASLAAEPLSLHGHPRPSPASVSEIPHIIVDTPRTSALDAQTRMSPKPTLDLTPTLSAPMAHLTDTIDTSDSDSTTFSATGTLSTAPSETSSLPPSSSKAEQSLVFDDDPVPFPTLAPVLDQPVASTSKQPSQAAYERLQMTLADVTNALEAARLETEEAQLREEAANAETDQMRAELTSAHWRWSEERATWGRREIELQNHINFLMQHVQAYAQALAYGQRANQTGSNTRNKLHRNPNSHRSTPSSPARGVPNYNPSPMPQPYIPVPPLSLSLPMYDTSASSSSSSPASSAVPSPASITNPLPPSLSVSPASSNLTSPMLPHAFSQFIPHTPSQLNETPTDPARGRSLKITKKSMGSDTLLMESMTGAVNNNGEISESLADAIFRRPEVILNMPAND